MNFSSPSIKIKVAAAIVFFAFFAWWINSDFLWHCGNTEVMKMNDHVNIVNSVSKIQFWRDHWGWWNASNKNAVLVYRPLMGYVAYSEVAVGLRYGWVWVGWIGFVLYLCSIASTAFLAWRWTRNWTACAVAATFCVLIRFFNPGQEGLWLI